jgi:vacuolar-type H+-ATPase subunit H
MQEIVNKVLEAEQQAEKTVQDARARAAEIRRQADQAGEAKLQQAREQAQSLIQESLAQTRAQVVREQEEAKAEAERRSARFLDERSDAIGAAAEAVVSLLVTPEQDRKSPAGSLRDAAGD